MRAIFHCLGKTCLEMQFKIFVSGDVRLSATIFTNRNVIWATRTIAPYKFDFFNDLCACHWTYAESVLLVNREGVHQIKQFFNS